MKRKKRKRKKKKKSGKSRKGRRRLSFRWILFILCNLILPICVYFYMKRDPSAVVTPPQQTHGDINTGNPSTRIPPQQQPEVLTDNVGKRLRVVGISNRKDHFFHKWDVLGEWDGKEFIVYHGEGISTTTDLEVDINYLEGRRYGKSRECLEKMAVNEKKITNFPCALLPFQSVNIFPLERTFTNKNNVTEFYTEMGKKFSDHPEFPDTFYPKTYKMFDDTERNEFREYLSEKLDEEGNVKKNCDIYDAHCKEDPQIWMEKAGSKTGGQGHGVIDPSELGQKLKDLSNPDKIREMKKSEELIQRYIHNPLLIRGKKCSIRQYVLVASLEPLLVLTYDDGRVMCATKDYDKNDIEYDDPGVHVTNNKLQAKLYGKPTPLLDFEMTEQDLNMNNESGQLYTMEKETFGEDFNTKMNRITSYTIKAFREFLFDYLDKDTFDLFGSRGGEVPHFFALYGADTVVDDDGAVWVTEFQYLISFELNDPVKDRILRELGHEMVLILIEINDIRNEYRKETRNEKQISPEKLEEYRQRVANLESVEHFMWVLQGDIDHYPVPS